MMFSKWKFRFHFLVLYTIANYKKYLRNERITSCHQNKQIQRVFWFPRITKTILMLDEMRVSIFLQIRYKKGGIHHNFTGSSKKDSHINVFQNVVDKSYNFKNLIWQSVLTRKIVIQNKIQKKLFFFSNRAPSPLSILIQKLPS